MTYIIGEEEARVDRELLKRLSDAFHEGLPLSLQHDYLSVLDRHKPVESFFEKARKIQELRESCSVEDKGEPIGFRRYE